MSSLEIKTKDTPELSEKELKQKQIENKEKREKALKEYEEERKPHIEQKLIFLYKQETKVCKLEKDYLKIKEWDEIIEKWYKEPEKCMIEFKKAEEYANKGLEELEANEKKLENNKEQEENREEIIFDKDIKKELIEKFKEIKELSSLKKENYILNIISESILTSNDDYFHLELNSENILKLKEDIWKSLNKDVLDVNDNDIKELKNNTNKLKEVILWKVLKKNKWELTYYGANVIDKNKEDRTDIENILSWDLPYKEKITKAIEFSNKVNPKKTREFIDYELIETPDLFKEDIEKAWLDYEYLLNQNDYIEFFDYVESKWLSNLILEFRKYVQVFDDNKKMIWWRSMIAQKRERWVDIREWEFCNWIPEWANPVLIKLLKLGVFNDETWKYDNKKALDFFKGIEEKYKQKDEMYDKIMENSKEDELTKKDKDFIKKNIENILLYKWMSHNILKNIIDKNANYITWDYNWENELLKIYGEINWIWLTNVSIETEEQMLEIIKTLSIAWISFIPWIWLSTLTASAVSRWMIVWLNTSSKLARMDKLGRVSWLANNTEKMFANSMLVWAWLKSSKWWWGMVYRWTTYWLSSIPFYGWFSFSREFIENMETHWIMENLKESFWESVEWYSSQEFLSFLFAFGYLWAASKIWKWWLKKAMIDMSVITTFDVSSRAVDNFIKWDFEKMPFNEVQIMLNMLLVLALKWWRTERWKTINNNQKETSSNAWVHKKALDPFAALNNLSYRVIVPSSVFAYGLNLENVMSWFEWKTDKNFKLNNEFEELVKKSESWEISEWEFRDKWKELIEKIFNEKLINKIPEDTEWYEILLKQLEIEKEKNKKMFEIVFIDMIDTKQINDKDWLWSEYFREVVVEKLRERITWKKDSEYEDREWIRLE